MLSKNIIGVGDPANRAPDGLLVEQFSLANLDEYSSVLVAILQYSIRIEAQPDSNQKFPSSAT